MGKNKRQIIKKHHKTLIFGIIIGMIIASGGVYAITSIAGSNITYSNTNSGLSSTNVQGAIDELYDKANKTGKFVEAYTYSESGANKCITGEESTCKETTCYKTKTANSCPAGTIVKYKVNNNEIVAFHVMFDKGSKLIMQSQKNIITETVWHNNNNYDNNDGPLTALNSLDANTYRWSNVNNITYTMGTTVFADNAYTGCSTYDSCTQNTYTLSERTGKARMITIQEAKALGCTEDNQSCPIWMYNYLSLSIDYGGSVNGNGQGYWTMTASSDFGSHAWFINSFGGSTHYYTTTSGMAIRPVVEVSK